MSEGILAGTAFINILPSFAGFDKAMRGIQARAAATGRELTHKITLPALAIGAVSIKLAADFDESMTKIKGLVGESDAQIKTYKQSILALAPAVGQGPRALADALYFITSAGLHGSAALDVLKQSAMGASSGLGDVKTVADAVTSAVNAYGAKNLSASKAVDILSNTVRLGKVAADRLAPVLGAVLPLSQRLGVSFDQVGASLAAMTRIGSSAPQATTALRGLYSSLLNITPKVTKALKAHGLTQQQLIDQLKNPREGLPVVLKTLSKAFGNNVLEIRKAFPNLRGLQGLLSLTGKNSKATQTIFEQMRHSAGQNAKAFAATVEDPAFQLHKFSAAAQVAAIQLGNTLLPTLNLVLGGLEHLTTWFSNLSQSTRSWIGVVAIAVVAAGPLLSVFSRLLLLVSPLWRYLKYLRVAYLAMSAAQSAAAVTATEQAAAASAASVALVEEAAASDAAAVQLELFGAAVVETDGQLGLFAYELTGVSTAEMLMAAEADLAATSLVAESVAADVATVSTSGLLFVLTEAVLPLTLIAVGVGLMGYLMYEASKSSDVFADGVKTATKAATDYATALTDIKNAHGEVTADQLAVKHDKLAVKAAEASGNVRALARALHQLKRDEKALHDQRNAEKNVVAQGAAARTALIHSLLGQGGHAANVAAAQATKAGLGGRGVISPENAAARAKFIDDATYKNYIAQLDRDIAGAKGQTQINEKLIRAFAVMSHKAHKGLPSADVIGQALSNKNPKINLTGFANNLVRQGKTIGIRTGKNVVRGFVDQVTGKSDLVQGVIKGIKADDPGYYDAGTTVGNNFGDAVLTAVQDKLDAQLVNIINNAASQSSLPSLTPGSNPKKPHKTKHPHGSTTNHGAGGGNPAGGSMWLVGETGPELFVPRVSGRIVPNHAMAATLNGHGHGGRAAITITNWKEGTGYMEDVSEGVAARHAANRQTRSRMSR